ncbi:MAG: aminotransferase class III-fold pyridoxal phosphate-dependent enzyme, partial [Pseudomonadota bacterium]
MSSRKKKPVEPAKMGANDKKMEKLRPEPAMPQEPETESIDNDGAPAVAIIGMAGRFPGAPSVDALWALLKEGKEAITRFSDKELETAGVDPEVFKQSGYVPVRGLIDEPEAFDAAFFGIGPHEALLMDPQQRLFLETCWHGLEHSGYAPNTMKHVVGVWGGMSTGMTNNTYLLSNLHATPDALSPEQVLTAMLGNENDYLTTRVSYKLNLRGPSVNVQTACSTSLVAVVHAAQSLLTYGCDVALAGGVSVSYPQAEGYMYQEGGIGSPDGHCRPFDSEAQGTVFSNGVGVVVLKRLEDAEADGDTIYGVIRGFGMNNDGSDKVSFAAPSVSGQAQAVRMAWEMAGIDPSTLSYVETHGTATPLGDPIEVAALTKAMVSRARNDIKVEPCALGSVKSNFGHLDSAAGVTALIKATLCLYHRTLVPTLHFKKPNPNINFDHGRFYVNTETKHWNVEGHPRRAAVSGFGIGGTNAHLVLEEWMDRRSSLYPVEESKPQLLTLSAQSATSLQRTQDHWKNWLSEEGKPRFLDAIDTLNRGRAVFEHRVACVGKSWADILHVLNESKLIVRGQAQAVTSPVFLFAGGGAQYVRMGLEVIQQLPTIRHRVEQECAWLKNQYGIDLQAHWFAMPGSAAANAFAKPSIQLPSLFLLEYALAEQLMEWGIQPAALLGHSMGENVAATVAGVFDLRSALGLVVLRGQLFERITADAAMLSVPISAEELKPKLGNLDLATVNGPQQCTVAGIRQDLEFFRQQLDQEGIDAQWVPIAVAAHSRLLEPVLPDFLTYLKKQKLNPPKFPVLSNVTGEFLKPEEAQDPDYWVRQLRYTVQFDSNLQQAGALKNPLFIEVGPGKLLTSLVKLNLPHLADHVTHLLPHAKEQENSVLTLLRGVGQLWCWGVPVDRQAIFDAQDSTHDSVKNSHDHSKNSHAKNNAHQLTHHRRVALPLYAFEPTRFYFTPPKSNRSVCEVITSFAPTLSASAISAPTLAPVQTLGLPTLTKPVDVLQASVPQQDSKYASRLEWVEETLGALLADFSGSTWDVADNEKLFSDLGYDSLFLTQLSLKLKKKFTVKVRFRQLQEELATVKDLSAWIDQELPAESFASDWQTSSTPTNSIPSGGTAMVMPNFNPSADPWQALVDTQWHAVQVLAQMTGRYLPAMGSGNSSSNNSPEIPEDWWPNPVALELAKKLQQEPSEDVSTKQRMGPFKALQRELTSDLSPEQNAYLDDFMARYIARTSESKRIAQKNRIYYADPRTVAGFKARWKEIVYSVASIKSQGADLWDVDGNQYVDVVGGFGAAYFGQNPVFLGKAIAEQLNTNNDYGPANEEVGEAARLLCEMTQMDRASFCNTGSEAVLATMRIARTVTGNTLIAKFGGAYHGIFDEVLGKTRRYGDITANITVAPGIPASAQQHIVVLEYNNPKSLEIIRALGEELAGIIIEPVQSRTPELQPIAFVQQVRELARELDIPFIFDEIITGFRLHPRGAQHWFNVDADICAYGKVIGGGFPVGAVAGKRRFLDALDGGFWQFGDTSFPEVGVTYFAGTFVRHPLSIAAVRAVLTYLKQEGPELQARVNRAASVFCERINLAFQERRIPIYMVYVGSVILTRFYGHPDFEGLFFHHLRYFGVHMY